MKIILVVCCWLSLLPLAGLKASQFPRQIYGESLTFSAGEPILLESNYVKCLPSPYFRPAWQWSLRSEGGRIIPLTAVWLRDDGGSSAIRIALFSKKLKPGHDYRLFINGEQSGRYLSEIESWQNESLIIRIRKKRLRNPHRAQLDAGWAIKRIRVGLHGTSLTLRKPIAFRVEWPELIIRAESLSGQEVIKTQHLIVPAFHLDSPTDDMELQSSPYGGSIGLEFDHSYRVSLFTGYRGKYFPLAGWLLKIPPKPDFSDQVKEKLPEYERLHSLINRPNSSSLDLKTLNDWGQKNQDWSTQYFKERDQIYEFSPTETVQQVINNRETLSLDYWVPQTAQPPEAESKSPRLQRNVPHEERRVPRLRPDQANLLPVLITIGD